MSHRKLSIEDLPLGLIAPEAPYNALLARGIKAREDGNSLSRQEMDEIEQRRREVWSEIQAMKDRGMKHYSRYVARQHEFSYDEQGLHFDWKKTDFKRIGYESNYYASDAETKTLVPVELDPEGPRVIVFASGRAFAERNVRLLHLSPEEAMEHARYIMAAQCHLARSRLVLNAGSDGPQVAAFAYDMVTSEFEIPAMRLQSILDPDFIHPVSMTTAERVFGNLIADAEFTERGTFVRKDHKILGKPLADAEIIDRLNGLVLVGGSVGCVVTIQATLYLRQLLTELAVSDPVVDQAMSSFLIINLGPTTILPVDPCTNHLAVINMSDEFVFAGLDVGPLIAKAKASGHCLVANQKPTPSGSSRDVSIILDGPGTTYEGPEGKVFDPDGTHFGHSLKHYFTDLRDRGFANLLERVFQTRGAFNIADLMHEAEAHGEVNLRLEA